MALRNCWENKGCGREAGGTRAVELGVCPAATDRASDGCNGGTNGGRVCWSVAGTLCGGEVQGTFASKRPACAACDFFRTVQIAQGTHFQLLRPGESASPQQLEQFTSIVSIIDAMDALLYVSDLETHELLYLNAYGAGLFGADAVGKRCWEVLQVGQDGPCSFCTNHRLLQDGKAGPPVVWEFRNTVTGNWFQCIDRAIPWLDGRLVRMEIAVDISARREADRFREEYLGLISHDLRNPLGAVMLRAQLIRRALAEKGLTAELADLELLVVSARQMDDLIGDLLETSRIDAGRLDLDRELLDLGERIAQAVGRIGSPSERKRVEIPVRGGPLPVSADPLRLDRVLDNLLGNALKYSEAPVSLSVARRGGEAVVSVTDRGLGIPAPELPRLFQRFYRASNAGGIKGLGLGLYNARMIVEAHGGRIWAESDAGRGSTFGFALPLAVAL